MALYDHNQRSEATTEDAVAAVGRRAVLPLTGRIVGMGESQAGVYVEFEVDSRWGFAPGLKLVMDLECFELEDD